MSHFKAMLVHLHQALVVLLMIVGLMLLAPSPALLQHDVTVDEWNARCSEQCLYSVAFD